MSGESNAKDMSFWEHVDELRSTIVHSFVAIALMSVLAFVFKDAIFSVVFAPCHSDFFLYKLLDWKLDLDLINIELAAQFFVHVKVALSLGVIASVPYIIWELWRFLSPALYDNETKAVKNVFISSSLFFYLGAATSYFFVLPVCLRFFADYSVSSDIVNTVSLNSYISMFLSTILLIALVFEFPLAVIALNRMGILGKDTLKKGRKYAIVVMLVIAAIITPSDPFSMLVLAIPLYALYEISILFSKK